MPIRFMGLLPSPFEIYRQTKGYREDCEAVGQDRSVFVRRRSVRALLSVYSEETCSLHGQPFNLSMIESLQINNDKESASIGDAATESVMPYE